MRKLSVVLMIFGMACFVSVGCGDGGSVGDTSHLESGEGEDEAAAARSAYETAGKKGGKGGPTEAAPAEGGTTEE